MKIKMLQTVEDSHGYVANDDAGQPEVRYDVRKFAEGAEYDATTGGPDWERRAAGLVSLGYAEQVG